jgi:hypothetical protein
VWIKFVCSELGLLAGSCEHSNEPLHKIRTVPSGTVVHKIFEAYKTRLEVSMVKKFNVEVFWGDTTHDMKYNMSSHKLGEFLSLHVDRWCLSE